MIAENTITSAEDVAEVRALFLRQVEAENAHDIAGIDAILAPELAGIGDAPMFVARAGQFFGREAVLRRFRDNFAGTWKLSTVASSVMVGISVAGKCTVCTALIKSPASRPR